MRWLKSEITVRSSGKGLYEFTRQVEDFIRQNNVEEGICHLYIQHTSASMVISENADPTAKIDLESFMDRIAPENQSWHRHTLEGSDDSPSHMKSIITHTSESIPIDNGSLSLGTWQGIYLFEHRNYPHTRRILIRVFSTT